ARARRDGNDGQGEVRRRRAARRGLRLRDDQWTTGGAHREPFSSALAYRCAIRLVNRRDGRALTSTATACSSSFFRSAASVIVDANATYAKTDFLSDRAIARSKS